MISRFWSKVKMFPGEGSAECCWVWTGQKINGYGRFWINSKSVYAHRVSYALRYPGFSLTCTSRSVDQLDHVCRNRACVNPTHLEPITNRKNTLKGKLSALKANKSSKFPGVDFRKDRSKWRARIQISGKVESLGCFDTEAEAADAYKETLALFGENI
jgi:hypothetical protein